MKNRLLLYLLLSLFLIYSSIDSFSQGYLLHDNDTFKVDQFSSLIRIEQTDQLTITDNIIMIQFLLENDPENIRLSEKPEMYVNGIMEQEKYSGYVSTRLPSPYFNISDFTSGKKKKNITEADSFVMRNQGASIWKKMGRAELFIGGTELICMGVLMAMPKEVTKWQPGFLNDAMKNIKRAFTTMPENDEDGWGFNYVGHPIAGSLYYNSIRSQDATIFQSFVFSFAQSAFWEYVIEGAAEQPSLQDLLITPIFGTLLGEASHVATIKMRRNGFNWLEKITVIVLNPFYAVNNGFRTTNKKSVKW